jgi:Tol biopolymer transport system component
MKRHIAIAIAVAVLAVLAAAGSALSTGQASNGRILYYQQVNGKEQLFTIRADGSGRKQLTHGPTHSLNGDWSPDGKLIVFERIAADDSHAGVAVMNADGSDVRLLTPTGYQGDPSFTPDGRQIVFARSEQGDDVWLMNLDGSDQHKVPGTHNPEHDDGKCGCIVDATVSPDGKTVSFVRIAPDWGSQALFSVGIDGTGLRRLAPYSADIGLKHDWSPDGKLIVYTSPGDPALGRSANMYVMRPDGSGKRAVTRYKDGTRAFAGSFSPDGKWIVFRVEDGKGYHLSRIRPDGTGFHVISNAREMQRSSAWGTAR